MTIAVVEDDSNMQIQLERYLESITERDLNFFQKAGDVIEWIEGLDETEKRALDLMLMDIRLPDTDGITTTARLKEDPALKNVPVLAVTGLDSVEKLSEAFDAGCMDYITKPLTKVEFQARVKSALRLKNALDKERKMAIRDGLTELYNRRHFNEQIQKEFGRAQRKGNPLTLILCDVDYFKQYNDTYGHTAGDTALKEIARALENSVRRPSDFVARFGGEEFVVILPDTDREGANECAESIRINILDLEIDHRNSKVSDVLTISLGFSTQVPDRRASYEDLISTADEALYEAKDEGRNQSVFKSTDSTPNHHS